jgi:hypothetical protein
MDTLETMLAAALPADISSAPLAEEPDEDASIEDVAEGIDRSIYAALVAS